MTGSNGTVGTPEKRDRFLEEFAKSGNVSGAARVAGIGRSTHYRWLDDPDYREAFESARESAVDLLEAEARRRALEGVEESVYYQGVEVGRVRKYSDVLLIFLLKGHRPEKYRERYDVNSSVTNGNIRVIEDEGWYGNDAHERANNGPAQN